VVVLLFFWLLFKGVWCGVDVACCCSFSLAGVAFFFLSGDGGKKKKRAFLWGRLVPAARALLRRVGACVKVWCGGQRVD